MNIDKAFEEFKKIKTEISSYSENLSETDTRCKYLDRIFKDVLGWAEDNIVREGYVKPGFFDYEFSTSQFRFVVEAKKNSVKLVLPEGKSKVKLRTLYTSNSEVIDQIRDYITKRNIAYGIISNGTQYVIAKYVNTDGNEWDDNEAYIFNGIDFIEKDFINFFNLLAYDNVLYNGRIKLFKEDITGKHIVEQRQLRKKTDEVIRNEFGDLLVPIIGQIFSEIIDSDELNNYEKLKECYISNEDVKANNSKLGILFEDEPPRFDSRIIPVMNSKHTQKQITEQIEKPIGPTPEPVILIGSKGSGKTTFIKYFIEITLSEKVRIERPIVYIDFRNYTKQQVSDTKGIYSKIYRQLVEECEQLNLTKLNILKTIYAREIKENSEGIWSLHSSNNVKLEEKISEFIERRVDDIINHLESISKYLLKYQRKRLTIILDNADQLDDESQRELFLLAQSIRITLSSLVILSLREGYFYQWKNKPPFDAYQSNVFHITAPPYHAVLKRRIDYVIEHFNFDSIKTTHRDKSLSISSEALRNLFNSLSNSLFGVAQSELLEFLEETSYPNIREGLESFNSFLISGHSQIADYITSDKYWIPIWEFVKSIGLESQYYYRSEFSRIKNLFNPTSKNRNHFTKIRLLFYLKNQAELHSYKSHYVSSTEVLELFCKAGYFKEILIVELTSLLAFKLIETKASESDIEQQLPISENSEFKLTQAGNYYLTKLINRFHYLDLILQDTPIYEEYYFDRLIEVFPEVDDYGERDIEYRVITVTTFIEYLKKMEWFDHSMNELNYGDKALDINIVDYIERTGLNKDIERIRQALKK